ncbi:MAG TPA: carboxypeptidase-like regulatory domain-containing protein, partial [Dehalococcoidia bacterium]|nr:carboxypeptidase-like regulatory domain-containing protein [Dehalococcoidia bacterium]
GRRVPGATVRLVTADGVVIARTLSDDRGGFSFRALRPGHYHVVANKRGVGEGSVRVAVRDDQIVRVRVVLRD